MNKLLESLISFVGEEIGVDSITISEDSLIENDLGVTGGDAVQLIKDYSRKFGVDIRNFEYSKYFYPEPSIFATHKGIKPLTIGDLVKGIELGKLDDSVIRG